MAVDYINEYARAQPDQLALIGADRVLTWHQFEERRNRVGLGLLALGVAPSSTVAVYERNSADYFVVLSAIQAIGATAVQINWRLAPEEVLYILDNSDAVAAFVNDDFLSAVDQIVDQSAVQSWIIIGEQQRAWAENLDVMIDKAGDSVLPDRPPGATMLYTGGTTGRPKGVRRDAFAPESVDAGILEAMTAWRHTMHLDAAHTHLVTAALYHTGPVGYATMALSAGGTAVVMPTFEPVEALRLIEAHRCTSTFMPPTLAKRVLQLPEEVRRHYDLSSLSVFVVTAAPVPQKLKEDILDAFGPVYYEAYTSTETAYCATALTPADVRQRVGSCGRVLAGPQFTVRDDNGQQLPPGHAGMVCAPNLRGMFAGYHKDASLSADVIHDEWLTVGDIGYLDDDGFLYIVDRRRDMIISGGVNIYSAEIEKVLHGHPAILDVAVFGVPDDEWGERVHAAVQLNPDHTLTLEELQSFARHHLAGYKLPRELSLHETFPRDAAGKLTKNDLREPFWRDHARRI